jgi:hypothetical protein
MDLQRGLKHHLCQLSSACDKSLLTMQRCQDCLREAVSVILDLAHSNFRLWTRVKARGIARSGQGLDLTTIQDSD